MSESRRKTGGGRPSAVGDILDSMLGKFGLKKRIRENEVFLVWEQAVGPVVTRHCRPLSITDGILVIKAKNNVWMQELSLLRQGIICKINELLGWEAVRDLRFKIGEVEGKAADEYIKGPKKGICPSENHEEEVDEDTEREIRQALEGIDDPELARALRSMMIRGIKRSKPGNPPPR